MISRLSKKIQHVRQDPHMREVAQGAAIAFGLKVLGSGLMFGFNVAIARLLGAEGAGLYFLAFSVTAIASVVARLGLDNAMLRFVATHATKDEWGTVQGVYALGIKMALIASFVMTALIFSLSPWVATSLFDKPELAEPLRWMSLSILPFTLLNLQAESLKGLKCIRDAMFIQGVGLPLLALLLVFPLADWLSSGLMGVIWSYTLGATMMALLGIWRWRVNMSEHRDTEPFPFKTLWLSCKPLFFTSLLNRAFFPLFPLVILGMWVSNEDVGLYGAATRVVMLVSFILISMNTILAPKFAEFHEQKNMKDLELLARRSALMMTMVALPIFVFFLFKGYWVMSIFGDSFEQAGYLLAILAFGQLVNAFTGSVGFVLMMGGKEGVAAKALAYSAVILLCLLLMMIPVWGVTGCVIAVMLSEVVKNILLACFCKKHLGLNVVPFFGEKK